MNSLPAVLSLVCDAKVLGMPGHQPADVVEPSQLDRIRTSDQQNNNYAATTPCAVSIIGIG